MKEVLIKFEEEGLEGIVAVDTYLIDAARRLGIDVSDECRQGEDHQCSMKVSGGAELLSEATAVEREVLGENRIKKGERLSCQAKIDKAGEVTVMSVEKPKNEEKKKEEKTPEKEFRKEFEEMPLEKKIASLVELEAIALGETFSYVLNSPYEAAGKVMDYLADFGWKKDRADQEAKKPDEHAPEPEKETEAAESASRKAAGTKKTKKK